MHIALLLVVVCWYIVGAATTYPADGCVAPSVSEAALGNPALCQWTEARSARCAVRLWIKSVMHSYIKPRRMQRSPGCHLTTRY
jgi:hypothetical protein